MRTITIALAIMLSLLCCSSVEKKPEPEGVLLTQNELEKIFSKEITYINIRGMKSKNRENAGEITCFPNGTQIWIWLDKTDTLQGTYRIENGQKCDRWIGKEVCWKIYKLSDKRYYLESDDGSNFRYITLKY